MATNAVVTVEFNGEVVSAGVDGGAASYAGNQATFEVPDLEATPTSFTVDIDVCGEMDGEPVVASVTYADEEENTPDMSALPAEGVISNDYCDGGKLRGDALLGIDVVLASCTQQQYYR